MPFTRTIIASSLFLLTALALPFLSQSKAVSLQKPLSTFPMKIGDWDGHKDRFSDQVLSIVGVDDYLLANYAAPEGRLVGLYVGYYESQRKGDLIHSPKNCMPGGGWNITETSSEKIKLQGKNSRNNRGHQASIAKGR